MRDSTDICSISWRAVSKAFILSRCFGIFEDTSGRDGKTPYTNSFGTRPFGRIVSLHALSDNLKAVSRSTLGFLSRLLLNTRRNAP